MRHAGSDALMGCTARRTAYWKSRAGPAPAWLYSFAHAPAGPAGAFPFLAHHSSEIPFVFHILEASRLWSNASLHGHAEVALSATIARLWAQMASEGTPNGHPNVSLTWPAYEHNGTSAETLVFGNETSAHASFHRRRCDFWDSVQLAPTGPATNRQWLPLSEDMVIAAMLA
jgi:carboxylesterase type B